MIYLFIYTYMLFKYPIQRQTEISLTKANKNICIFLEHPKNVHSHMFKNQRLSNFNQKWLFWVWRILCFNKFEKIIRPYLSMWVESFYRILTHFYPHRATFFIIDLSDKMSQYLTMINWYITHSILLKLYFTTEFEFFFFFSLINHYHSVLLGVSVLFGCRHADSEYMCTHTHIHTHTIIYVILREREREKKKGYKSFLKFFFGWEVWTKTTLIIGL